MVKQMRATPPPLPNTTPAVQSVTNQALAKDPEDRFQSAGELAEAFSAALELAEGVEYESDWAAATQSLTPATESRSSFKPIWIVGAVAALAIIIAAVLALSAAPGERDN